MIIPWREKFRAFGIHFAVTAALSGLAAALIFLVWFPAPFATLVGGTGLFVLLVTCDVVLGPLLSLVVYDSRKSRGKLVFDYAVIGTVQLAALIYGVWILAATRPVYVAFISDRFEVVSASDLLPKELAAARDPAYSKVPFSGVRFVAIEVRPEDRENALFEALAGNEEGGRPRFYVPYDSQLEAIRKRAYPFPQLLARHPESAAIFKAERARIDLPDERLRWLPLRYKEKFWTAFIDTETGKPVRYVDVDPY